MPIDGIGKPPAAPPPSGGADGPKRASEATRPFEVGGARTEAATSIDATAATSPLGRLQAGEIDLGGYLDARVDEATSHLQGLGSEELGAIRAHLRSAIASDPALVDLVRLATGKTPEPERE